MTDIVERLRFGSLTHMGASKLNLEAADEIERLRAALEWFEKQRQDAIRRAEVVHAPEDEAVLTLCRRHGFGAVMDSAARQWARLPEGKPGAFFIGGCIGDTTARAALTQGGE